MALKFVIIGGGPGGHAAATQAAKLGADVTIVERDIIGGAAHLWDCIPSKAMIATGSALNFINRSEQMGLTDVTAQLDFDGLRERIQSIENRLEGSVTQLLASQGVRVLHGTGRLAGPHEVVAQTAQGEVRLDADAVLLSSGSRPRIPDWAEPDGDRILTTRDAYPPKELPSHLIVIGSGVTGVEFVSMFSQLRVRRDPHRVAAAGAAGQGPGGRRCARGRVPGPGRPTVQGGPGRGDRTYA